jgi:hypothetical protein
MWHTVMAEDDLWEGEIADGNIEVLAPDVNC